jgi:aspartate/methionine/tyrosine aminotransferase
MKNSHTLSLTEFEYEGLRAEVSLADGHAYQDLHADLEFVLNDLGGIWTRAARGKILDIEAEFSHAFGVAANSPTLSSYEHFRICPTASNSIDLAATWLKMSGKRTALLEPTFDNLALILRRRGVPLQSLSECELRDALKSGTLTRVLSRSKIDALFLVNPNNPTGSVIELQDFQSIIDACLTNNITLLLDCTFRFFVPNEIDHYSMLVESGVTFIVIEDTGKTWPTLDMKASLLCFSNDIKREMHQIYEEIYLCISPFTLCFMQVLIEKSNKIGFKDLIWDLVEMRRTEIRALIKGTKYQVDPSALNSSLGLEWLRCMDSEITDIHTTERLREEGVCVLPGRYFFWSCPEERKNHRNIRISLMRQNTTFNEGIRRLQAGLERLSGRSDRVQSSVPLEAV